MEERRRTYTGHRADPPGREEAAALADLLAGHEELFVSFQDCGHLALNPDYSNEATPRAVYAFPVRWLLAHARHHAGARKPDETPFAGLGFNRRPNTFVFAVAGRVLDTETYRGYLDDQARLAAALAEGGPAVEDIVESFNRHARPGGGPDDARRLWHLTERVVDRRLGIVRGRDDYAVHPGKPETWRLAFRAMGFSALRDGCAMMTGDYPRQLAVFDDAAIDLRAVFDNPCAADPGPAPGR